MQLYLLTTKPLTGRTFSSKLIRAHSQSRARYIANRVVGAEGQIWEDEDEVKCEIILGTGCEGVILSDFSL